MSTYSAIDSTSVGALASYPWEFTDVEASSSSPLSRAIEGIQQRLSIWAASPTAMVQLEQVFTITDYSAVALYLEDWNNNIFNVGPEIIILDDALMQGAQGAYTAAREQIFLAKSTVNGDSVTGLEAILLEEYGHYLDTKFNPGQDSPGDEGELFSLVLLGSPITEEELLRIQTENDFATLLIDGQEIIVEQSTFNVDFNGDHRPDILWQQSQRGVNALWFMGGTNNAQMINSASLQSTAPGWKIKGVADFNGDGRPDILWRHRLSGSNVVWFMGGTQNTQIIDSVLLQSASSGWDIKGIADFNGDNRPDILWRNADSGANVVWFMGGTQNTQIVNSTSLQSTNPLWDIKGIADFNGDSRPDILWRNELTGENTVWFMGGTQNTQIGSSAALPREVRGWDIKGIADFNGDQRPDLLWQHTQTGANTVWLMGGTQNTQRIGSTAIASPGKGWEPVLKGWQQPNLSPPIDIEATSLQVNNGMYGIHTLKPGDRVSLSFSFTETNVTAPFYQVGFYLSADSVIDSKDIYLGETGIQPYNYESYISSLTLFDQSHNIWNANPVDQYGYALYYIGMKGDVGNKIAEINESNNEKVAAFWVYQPEKIAALPTVTLVASDSTASESGDTGKFTFTRTGNINSPLTVYYTIGGTATNSSDYATILSSITFAAGQPTVDQIITPIDDVLVEGNETVQLTLTTNSAYLMGSTTSAIVTIFDNDFAKPDLTLSSPNAPSPITVGQTFNLNTYVSNQGTANAGQSYLRYYLSEDNSYSSNDIYLGQNYINNINSGSSTYQSLNLVYDHSWGTGTKYILFFADATNLVSESNEGNNIASKAVTVNAPPYITVLSPNGGNSLTAGNSYTISWTDNISENVKIELYKGSSFHSTITSSTSSNGSYTWILPTALPAGNDYRIRIASVNTGSLYDDSNSVFGIVAAPSFNIQFDYRFDTNGWFTSIRKAALEAAATIWESIILDEFTDIPVGTSLNVKNPQTSEMITFNSDYVIDDLVIFVGAQNLTSLGIGGPSGTWFGGSSLETRYKGSDFEPWTGSVTFDSDAAWYYDADPLISDVIPAGYSDFVSVAVHEIGHVLGFGTSNAFRNLVTNIGGSYYFVGSKATSTNGGFSVPLGLDQVHILDGHGKTGPYGEASLDPTLMVGMRKLVNALDAAILDDIGYL
jgi:hypothetical protein